MKRRTRSDSSFCVVSKLYLCKLRVLLHRMFVHDRWLMRSFPLKWPLRALVAVVLPEEECPLLPSHRLLRVLPDLCVVWEVRAPI